MKNNRNNLTGDAGLLAAIIHQAHVDATTRGTTAAAQARRDEALGWFADGGHVAILDALDIHIYGGRFGTSLFGDDHDKK